MTHAQEIPKEKAEPGTQPEPSVEENLPGKPSDTPVKFTQQDVEDAIAYFRATSNRHDLTDILEAALGKSGKAAPTHPATTSKTQR